MLFSFYYCRFSGGKFGNLLMSRFLFFFSFYIFLHTIQFTHFWMDKFRKCICAYIIGSRYPTYSFLCMY